MSLHALVNGREMGSLRSQSVKRTAQSHASLVSRLSLDTELVGHRGCVNRLTWSEDGAVLASGSDDTDVYLWDYDRRAARHVFDTGEAHPALPSFKCFPLKCLRLNV